MLGKIEPPMLDIRKSCLAENLYADQLGNVYRKDKHGNYVEYTLWVDKLGYKRLHIGRLGKKTRLQAHRVVASAFHGESPEGYVCAHLNGKPGDDRPENLAWVTQRENLSHRKAHGTGTTGERNGCSKLTECQVREIRTLYATGGYTQRGLADTFKVNRKLVFAIIKHRKWAHLEP